MDDRLVDLVCVRETHQADGRDVVVSMRSGMLLLCPSGETLGHVWRAAPNVARPDDPRLARDIVSSRPSRLGLRAHN